MALEEWLLKRIEQEKRKRNNSEELTYIIGKGAKVTAYNEMLDYIRTHNPNQNT